MIDFLHNTHCTYFYKYVISVQIVASIQSLLSEMLKSLFKYEKHSKLSKMLPKIFQNYKFATNSTMHILNVFTKTYSKRSSENLRKWLIFFTISTIHVLIKSSGGVDTWRRMLGGKSLHKQYPDNRSVSIELYWIIHLWAKSRRRIS